jgi:hypothetical protein
MGIVSKVPLENDTVHLVLIGFIHMIFPGDVFTDLVLRAVTKFPMLKRSAWLPFT